MNEMKSLKSKAKKSNGTMPTALEKLKARLGEPTKAKRTVKKEEKPAKTADTSKSAPGTAVVFFPQKALTIKQADVNRDDFEKLTFVCKARSGDATRRNLTVLHVEGTRNGSRLIATDGKRLHFAETGLKITGGDYHPYVTKDVVNFGEAVEGINFPNWAKVVPDKPSKKADLSLRNTGCGKDVLQAERLSAAYTDFVRKAGVTVNLRFIEDLPKTDWAVYGKKEKDKPLVFKKADDPDGAYAVMMPLPEAA